MAEKRTPRHLLVSLLGEPRGELDQTHFAALESLISQIEKGDFDNVLFKAPPRAISRHMDVLSRMYGLFGCLPMEISDIAGLKELHFGKTVSGSRIGAIAKESRRRIRELMRLLFRDDPKLNTPEGQRARETFELLFVPFREEKANTFNYDDPIL